MDTRGRKAKGRNHILEIKEWLHKLYPEFADEDIIVPATSAPGEDMLFSPEFRKIFPFSVEGKRVEGLGTAYKFMEQAASNAGPHTPIVIMRSNRKPAMVQMYLTDFEKLL